MEKENRTELSELGEFGLIKHLTDQILLQNKTSMKGVGDDAAILSAPEGQKILLSTDMLVEGIHFDLSYVPLQHLGYKSVVVNLSDICAMNAIPQQITVSVAMSNRFSLEAMETLYSGIFRACEMYGVDLVGGDTTSSNSGLVISISVIGYAAEEKITTRSGARESELLVVSGDLGGAFLGLQVLEREKKVFLETQGIQPELTGYDYVLERQLKPEARKDIVDLLQILDVKPTSMIDISDGLASEILHLADQSDVGFDLYEEKIPMSPRTAEVADEFNLIRTTCALNGGEDYELLFTIKQSDFDKIKGNPNLTVIGHVTHAASGCRLITLSGEPIALRAQGWDPLR
ncbi:MAG: thiamine-phosphate kinase [Flavobacteriales bacterium]|nr:thiamine-phosphate kinase [Flavobacteriales bacterium]